MNLHGIERRSAALFAPAITSMPPGKSFISVVFALSRERFSATSARRTRISSIIEERRCLLNRFARFSVGWMVIIGAGAWWIT